MNKIQQYVSFRVIAVLICALLGMQSIMAASDPVNELSSIADQLIAKLKENKTSLKDNPQLVYSLANRIIVPHADIAEMSKRVLPPQIWNNATASQHKQFQSEFTTLLVHTYASALANYQDQTVKFYPVRGGYQNKTTVQVDSAIERPDGPPISVNYRLILKGSDWRLYDLNVEGVSMLESFRSQFADQLSQGNMDDLLKQLASHNTQGGE